MATEVRVPAPLDEPSLHGCAPRSDCPHCQRPPENTQSPDWSFLNAVYCISLKSRDDRAAKAADEFHRAGLCQKVVFYRPDKHPVKGTVGSWESHRAVAALAERAGARTTLICEDDVKFVRRMTPARTRGIARAMARLPNHWTIFYLGHWPLWSYFVSWSVLRTSSACAHAYIASPKLLAWLRAHPHGSTGVPKSSLVGRQLDSAFAKLPAAYAFFPMVATQSISRSDNFSTNRPRKKLKHIVSRSRHREWLLSHGMRPAEAVAVLFSPLAWAVQRLKRFQES